MMPPVPPDIRHRPRGDFDGLSHPVAGQLRKALPNIAASFRPESGMLLSMLAR